MPVSQPRHPLEALAEDFLKRYRSGERPSLTEYTQKHPELAERIRDLFPTLIILEAIGPGKAEPAGAYRGSVSADGKPLERLGDYRILREIGRGGMGLVYEAVQEALGRHVALKVLPYRLANDPTCVARFQCEARAAAHLHHTNIVPVFDVGVHDGVYCFAMQFIQGQSLDEVLLEVRRMRGVRLGGAQRSSIVSTSPHEPPTVEPHADEPHAEAPHAEVPHAEVPHAEVPHAEVPHSQDVGPERSDLTGDLASGMASGQFASADPTATGAQPDEGASASQETAGAGSNASSVHSELSTSSDYHYCRSVARIGVQVADALAYAHGQKVLHRDIKPSNLLLDLAGTVWITDFGLAKQESGDLTKTGDVVGTLRYMAPERFDGIADQRSDVYSLGLTLYELLTLRPAFAETDRARLIKQMTQAEPPRPRALDRRIPRDLETIVLKAIAKEPGRRYQTARALAEDLGRFLADRPILARRASRLERSWRWCRRNPMSAVLAATVLVSLVAGTGIAWILAVRASALAQDALTQKSHAETSAQTARQQQNRAESSLQVALVSLDEMTAVVINDLLVSQETITEEHRAYLRRVLALHERLAQETGDDPATRNAVGNAYLGVGVMHNQLGEHREATVAYARAVEIFDKLAAEFPTADYRMSQARALNNWGLACNALRKWDYSEAAFRRSLAVREALMAEFPEPLNHHDAAKTQMNLRSALENLNRDEEGRLLLGKALQTQERLAAQHPKAAKYRQEQARCYFALAADLIKQGKPPQAAENYRKALAIREQLVTDFPGVRQHRQELGLGFHALGEVFRISYSQEKAERAFRDALVHQERLVKDFPSAPVYRRELRTTCNNLGLVLMKDPTRHAEARDWLRQAVEHGERLLHDGDKMASVPLGIGGSCCNIGLLLRRQSEYAAALPWYDRAIAVLEPVYLMERQREQSKRFLQNAHRGRADSLSNLRRYRESLPHWERAISLAGDATLTDLRVELALTLARLGETGRAVELADAMARAKKITDLELFDLARIYALCAGASLGNSDKADVFAARAVALLKQAFAAGYFNFDRLDTDKDLKSLRQRDDFRNLRRKA